MPEDPASNTLANNARTSQNRLRAQSFGDDAASYDLIRPDYPSALIDDLLAGGATEVLDVGCGTGKAAKLLAERGVSVLGVEIDDRMADVARGHGVTVETAAFEQWDAAGRTFDLIVSGQAWHWVEPSVGVPKAVSLLRPGGALVPFWNFARLDDRTHAAIEAQYARLAPELSDESVVRGGGPATIAAQREELLAGGAFASVVLQSYAWQQVYRRDQWLELISSHSDHRTLAPGRLEPLLAGIGQAIDGLGGELLAQYETIAIFAAISSAIR
jgi:SAM-dependent methyltransferase